MKGFEDIFNNWIVLFDEGHVPNKPKPRVEAFINLLTLYKEVGYPRDYFTMRVKNYIVDSSYNSEAKLPKKEIFKWKKNVITSLVRAFSVVYPDLEAEITPIEAVPDVPEIESTPETHITPASKPAPKPQQPPKVVVDPEIPSGPKIFDADWLKVMGYDDE